MNLLSFFNKHIKLAINKNELEPISKRWLRVQGKAQADSKAEHTRKYVSILNRFATPPWTLRRIFEMGSKINQPAGNVIDETVSLQFADTQEGRI